MAQNAPHGTSDLNLGGEKESEMRSNLSEQDTLVPDRFASVFGQNTGSPEKRLILALLAGALWELQDAVRLEHRRDDPAFQRLESWFFSRDRAWPFSFENVCEHLDIDADWIRRRVAVLTREPRVPTQRQRAA